MSNLIKAICIYEAGERLNLDKVRSDILYLEAGQIRTTEVSEYLQGSKLVFLTTQSNCESSKMSQLIKIAEDLNIKPVYVSSMHANLKVDITTIYINEDLEGMITEFISDIMTILSPHIPNGIDAGEVIAFFEDKVLFNLKSYQFIDIGSSENSCKDISVTIDNGCQVSNIDKIIMILHASKNNTLAQINKILEYPYKKGLSILSSVIIDDNIDNLSVDVLFAIK